ncbi:hypothetical protein PIB30_017089 [Stylosanthes scabra]|uniref:Calmodulin-binding domain-containing protein n=1 Tax=Stylosanthes scabra TaxID=79078 RepID=A0ABU6T9J0_9FABA|nr:hypothetical protein [Stylosanthes scabra]
MVQRKVGIKGDHANNNKSEKRFANMKLSSSSSLSSQNQDGKNKGTDMKKKMMRKPVRSINLSDLEALQSSPSSRRFSSQPGKPPPPPSLHVPRTTTTSTPSASPQKQNSPVVRTIDGNSPNYMKPTSSSYAKKELFPVSLKNTTTQPSTNNSKNLQRKFSSDSRKVATSVSSKKSSKNFTRSSSLRLVRSLTKTTSFKASSRACPKKSTARATCSSTLKDSKFPAYLMLNHGGSESEGTSVAKVCPYTYCSLNGHCHRRHADLPPLKNFVSARRRLLKTQKSMMLDALSPRKPKMEVPCDTRNVSETGVDGFIEIYAKEKEAESIELLKFDCIEANEDPRDCFPNERNPGDEGNETMWSHEEISMGSYFSDDSYDGEGKKDTEMEDSDSDSDSRANGMEWGEKLLCGFGLEEEVADSSVFSDSENDSKVESLSQSSREVSVTWLDDILSSYYDDIFSEERLQMPESNSKESQSLEEQEGKSSVPEDVNEATEIQENGYSSCELDCDQSLLTEYSKLGEDNGNENENSHCQVKMFDMTEDGSMVIEEKEFLENDRGEANEFVRNIMSCREEQDTSKNWKIVINRKKGSEDEDEARNFNPREPNFLPLVPEPEAEKVDLRHQMMDERKNAEEWMLDSALRQVVTKLAPARKKKVALLVEAFEMVMPITKCEESHVRSNSSAFDPDSTRIQACR